MPQGAAERSSRGVACAGYAVAPWKYLDVRSTLPLLTSSLASGTSSAHSRKESPCNAGQGVGTVRLFAVDTVGEEMPEPFEGNFGGHGPTTDCLELLVPGQEA